MEWNGMSHAYKVKTSKLNWVLCCKLAKVATRELLFSNTRKSQVRINQEDNIYRGDHINEEYFICHFT